MHFVFFATDQELVPDFSLSRFQTRKLSLGPDTRSSSLSVNTKNFGPFGAFQWFCRYSIKDISKLLA